MSARFVYNINKAFRFPFNGCEDMKGGYSQAFQDTMILSLTKGKRNGTYLEIGASFPYHINNTYILSNKYQWNGVSIDFDPSLISSWKSIRPTDTFLCEDALKLDYTKLLHDNFPNQTHIDYLQLDVDPSPNTLAALKTLPMDKFRFGIITYETDMYLGNKDIRDESRSIFQNLGYTMIAGDVMADKVHPFEDWWVDMDSSTVDKDVAYAIMKLTTHQPERILFV